MFTTTWMDENGNIHYTAGDPFRLDLININDDGTLIDLSEWTISLRVFEANGNTTIKEFTEDDCDLTIPGALVMEKASADMINLTAGNQYYFDWKMGEPSKESTTWLNNKLFFVE